MATWRTLASLVTVLSITTAVQAQTYPLTETPAEGTCIRNPLDLKLAGTLKVKQEDKTLELKQTADATHDYLERVLTVDANGVVQRTARHYKAARVAISINGQRT